MRPVLIIGAPRSGTNLVRDLLCRLPGVGTWPCDEINPIWRHGNASYPTDELLPEHATDAVRRFVRRAFEKRVKRGGLSQVVEKTCANSLRVPFVRKIIPEARFIFLTREGPDAVASAILRWHSSFDLLYTLRKARFVPPSDFPGYLVRFLSNRLGRRSSPDGRLSTWGPRFRGMDSVVREQGVAAACALQWLRCVDSASAALSDLTPDRLISVSYRDFVTRPEEEMRRLARFLERELDRDRARKLTEGVTSSRLGSWRALLSPGDREVVERLLAPRQDRFSNPHAGAVDAHRNA